MPEIDQFLLLRCRNLFVSDLTEVFVFHRVHCSGRIEDRDGTLREQATVFVSEV